MDRLEKLLKKQNYLIVEQRRLEKKLQNYNNKLRKLIKQVNDKKRKERDDRLWLRGSLTETILGDLSQVDVDFFVGFLLAVKNIKPDSETYIRFFNDGQKYFQGNKS